MNSIKTLFFSSLIFSTLTSLSQSSEIISEEGWEYVKSKNDVEVYSKKLTRYEIEAFKVTGLIEGSREAVTDLIMDIEGFVDWYPNCTAGEVLDGSTETEQFRRLEFKLPWPFDNRDVVNKLEVSSYPDSTWIQIINAADYVPQLKNVYRVGRTEGYWSIVEEKEDQIRLTYAAAGEPGGFPNWIVNMFLFDSPLEAINNLREIVKKRQVSE